MPINPTFLQRIIDNDPSLTCFFSDFSEFVVEELTSRDIITLFNALKSNTTITILNLENSNIGYSIKSLCELLQINRTINTINLSHNMLKNLNLIAIIDALDENPATAVTSLNLSCNGITDEGGQHLIKSKLVRNKLTSLDLRGNQLSELSFTVFLLPTKITTLDLSDNYMGHSINSIGPEFIGFLDRNKSLTSLNLSFHCLKKFSREALKNLCTALKTNTSLNYLGLASNKFDNVAAQNLSETLATNHSITSLDLSDNKIGDAGIKFLSEALKNNETLRSLLLAGNTISKFGAQYLSEALVTNHTLTSLDIGSNLSHKKGIIGGKIGVKYLCDMLKTNVTLTSINLSERVLSKGNLKTICDALTNNYSLLKITTRNDVIPQISFLTRNAKIVACLEPLNTLAEDISFIAGIDVEKMMTELASLVPLEMIATLDETHSLAEKYRLLTALGHITNANQYMIANVKDYPSKEQLKLEAELDALECLLPEFTHLLLQKIANQVLGHFILSGTISKQLLDKQPLAFQQLGFCTLTFVNPNLRQFAYKALFNFLNPTKDYLIAKKDTFENEIVLLSEQKFRSIVFPAIEACKDSLRKKEEEFLHMQGLQQSTDNKNLLLLLETCLPDCQHDLEELKKESLVLNYCYLPNLTRILPLSPHFLAEFRKHYPSCEIKSFFYFRLCIFSESFLVTLSQQGNLPTEEELEKYSQFTFKEFVKQYGIRFTQVRTEITKAVATCRVELKTNPGRGQDSDTPMEDQTPLSLTKTNGKRKNEELAIDNSSEEKPAKKPKTIQEALANNLLIFATQTPPVETTEERQENSSDRVVL
jgi:Ran GTPase-activating protein (RanGAP) involved in mRNA processing and transport